MIGIMEMLIRGDGLWIYMVLKESGVSCDFHPA